jgi:hypothetical protein
MCRDNVSYCFAQDNLSGCKIIEFITDAAAVNDGGVYVGEDKFTRYMIEHDRLLIVFVTVNCETYVLQLISAAGGLLPSAALKESFLILFKLSVSQLTDIRYKI